MNYVKILFILVFGDFGAIKEVSPMYDFSKMGPNR